MSSTWTMTEIGTAAGDVKKNFGEICLVIELNVYYELGEHKFVWDREKAEKNRQKHNVLFTVADRVFLDDYRIDDYDEFHSDDEERIKTVGRVEKILAVIYTERGDRNRIISARRATKDEEDEYYGQFGNC